MQHKTRNVVLKYRNKSFDHNWS